MEGGSVPKHLVLTAGLTPLHNTKEQTSPPSLTAASDTAAFLHFFVQPNMPCFLRSSQWIHLVVQFQDGLVDKNIFLLLLPT